MAACFCPDLSRVQTSVNDFTFTLHGTYGFPVAAAPRIMNSGMGEIFVTPEDFVHNHKQNQAHNLHLYTLIDELKRSHIEYSIASSPDIKNVSLHELSYTEISHHSRFSSHNLIQNMFLLMINPYYAPISCNASLKFSLTEKAKTVSTQKF